MAARLWTALLVLVGVFVMHGAQCTAAADGAGHPPSPAAHSEATWPTAALLSGDMGAAAVAVTASSGMTVGGAGEADDGHPADRSALAALAATAAGSSPGEHGTTAHLWTLCLAVLATGVVALVAFLLPHPALLARPALTYAQVLLGRLTPRRPPDLSELCLLRI
jgi:hypothetical protein